MKNCFACVLDLNQCLPNELYGIPNSRVSYNQEAAFYKYLCLFDTVFVVLMCHIYRRFYDNTQNF